MHINTKKILALTICLTSLSYTSILIANNPNYLSNTKSTPVTFPSEINLDSQATGDYVIKSLAPSTTTFQVKSLPAGFSIIDASGATPASCQVTQVAGTNSYTFPLDSEASCTLRLAYSSNIAGSFDDYLPTVCINPNYGCITPAEKTKFSVVSGGDDGTTTVEINDGQDIDASVSAGSGSFTVKNTGNNPWMGANVAKDDSSEDTWLTLSEPSSGGCSGEIPSQGTCTVDYTISGNHDLSAVISATGTNITTTSQNLIPDQNVSIGIEGDSSQQHLQYKALRVTNLTSKQLTISNLQATPPANFTLCNSTGSNCEPEYASTCQENGTIAANTGVCRMWYKADSSTSLNSGTNATVDISLTTTATGAANNSLTRETTFNYANYLYVGGQFTAAGGVATANRIARWDGSNWTNLLTGINGGSEGVTALADFKGDLYLGGTFINAGPTLTNNIARWNGIGFFALGTGITGTPVAVFSIASIGNILYASGLFSDAGGTSAANIAQWNGSAWSNLGTGLSNAGPVLGLDLTTQGNSLIVGGRFNNAGGITVNNLAKWENDTWSVITTGGTNRISALLDLNNTLYAGGQYTTIDGVTANNIASYDGANWSALGSGTLGVNSSVDTIKAASNNLIYTAGSFTSADGTAANRIAEYNITGNSWSALGSGLDDEADSLAILGSNLFVGGAFSSAGGVANTSRIAFWNSTTDSWSALSTGLNGNALALLVFPSINLT